MNSSYFILIVWFVLSGRTAIAQTPSSCKPDSLLIKAYAQEISSMALQRMYAVKSPDTALIRIPQIHKDSIISGLSAITHLALFDPSIDSIFNKYCMHADDYFGGQNAVEIYSDTKYEWTKKWKGGILTTGYGALDSLIGAWGGQLNIYYEWGGHNITARIFFDSNINIRAMADSLNHFYGIDYAHQLTIGGAAVGFSYKQDSVQHFGFSLGWSDCSMGCNFVRYWGFKVDNACTVSLERYSLRNDDRSTQPSMSYCNYFPLFVKDEKQSDHSLLIYPNPGHQSINVKGSAAADFIISDISGRILLRGKIAGPTPIAIESLASGIYWLKLSNTEGKVSVGKFVKE